ncbi:hypothetical protein LTS18_008603 [Coniosporium uncinatum]|uniref:Uncharacterized protein n=1 Tax=Coniosporium uncinatum TaxID=93489 RepID=A0ACC3DXD5_9PEZI|nr:hypothetical protein LTS18_008603 [Coniosporium uncinatum]
MRPENLDEGFDLCDDRAKAVEGGGQERKLQVARRGPGELERVMQRLEGLSVKGFTSLPARKRSAMLQDALTTKRWIFVIDDEADDHMLGGIDILRQAKEDAVMGQESWEMYYSKNWFRVEIQSLEWLARQEEARWWMKNLSVFIGPWKTQREVKRMLGEILAFRELENVVIEVSGREGDDEAQVESMMREEVERVAEVISERISGEVLVGEQEDYSKVPGSSIRIQRWFDGRWRRASKGRGEIVRREWENRTAKDN